MRTYNLADYKKALRRAAEDAYRNEVVDPGTEALDIGPRGNYSSKEEWIESRMEEWLTGR
jgi:hypothetical protein